MDSSSSSIEDTFHIQRERKLNTMKLPVILTCASTAEQFPQRTLTPPSNGLPIIIGRAADPDKQSKIKTSAPYQAAPDNAKFHCPVMSRTHAQLSWIDNKPYLQDTGSTHGTWYQPNKVFIADQKGRKTRVLSSPPWEKIPKSLPLQEGMTIRFGRAITNPSNSTRHSPLEVKVRFYRPAEPLKPGTYGLKDSHINFSDSSGDENRSAKPRHNTADSLLASLSKKQSPAGALTDQRSHAHFAPNSQSFTVAQTLDPPALTLKAGHASPSKALMRAKIVQQPLHQAASGDSTLNTVQPMRKDPSSELDRPAPIGNDHADASDPNRHQSDQSPSPLPSLVDSREKRTEEESISENKAGDENERERSNEIAKEDSLVELQCTYGARQSQSDYQEKHSDVEQESSSAEERDDNVQDEHGELEEDSSEISEESSSVDQASEAHDEEANNQVTQGHAQEESEVSANEESLDESSGSESSPEPLNPKVSSLYVASFQKKHATKPFKDVSVVTTITSQTQFTESLNQLPESLAKTVEVSYKLKPLHASSLGGTLAEYNVSNRLPVVHTHFRKSSKLRRLHKLSGEPELPTNRAVPSGNSTSKDIPAAPQVVDAPSAIQSKRKRPAEFDESEAENVTSSSGSRKVAKRAPESVCQHCSHENHAAKKPKLSSKLASAAQSFAIFALGGVATVAGILALENVIE
ncbi:hypothetical protein PCASD_02873 [Puccinia coronata f. sp. avenae]|uniref:FHA domain-containing protein n=1 Tax=Puccinia coronata f. sp. avenae TaxID=200324 RepID=A0A2N5VE95_9BASI|nr:hypothetical protein PCASD_02873 [Puccinia coronata f. sp. avenae]